MGRRIIKIAVTDTAKGVIEAFAKEYDMKEMGVASRVYEWLAKQDDVVQKGILGLLPKGYEVDLVGLVLQRIASDAQGKGRAVPKR